VILFVNGVQQQFMKLSSQNHPPKDLGDSECEGHKEGSFHEDLGLGLSFSVLWRFDGLKLC